MMFRNAARVIVILSVTTVMAQSNPPAATVPGGTDAINRGSGLGPRRFGSLGAKRSTGVQGAASLRQRLEDLEGTVNRMHTILNKMQARAAKSSVKDSSAKANLDMWELMVGHMDKELENLRVALAAHEDMEARRAALYKQADQKAEAQAQAGRAAMAAKLADKPETAAPVTTQDGGQTPAPTPAGQSSAPPANNPPSPN